MVVTELFKQNCLSHKQSLSNTLILLNVTNFSEAITYVGNLPYGRNSKRDNYKLIIEEKKGTCSTKHAFIKVLADENNIDLQLLIGIFLITSANTPAISSVLEKYNIKAIPEAHCYLRYKNITFDITFPGCIVDPCEFGILKEASITPSQIGKRKVNFHREFIRDWIFAENLSIANEMLWRCREDCIQALSRTTIERKIRWQNFIFVVQNNATCPQSFNCLPRIHLALTEKTARCHLTLFILRHGTTFLKAKMLKFLL